MTSPHRLGMLVSLAILTHCGTAWAANFQINPVEVLLTPDAPSGLVSIRNQSSEALPLHVSVFGWKQTPEGGMVLTPTDDIVFFPSMLELAPGETRRIRIGTKGGFARQEKTYRLFVEELAPVRRTGGQMAQGVRMLTRMGIPVYLQAAEPKRDPRVEVLGLKEGKLTVRVKNAGTIHFRAVSVRTKLLGADRKTLGEQVSAGWYVLPGGHQDLVIDIDAKACRAAGAIAVQLSTERNETVESEVAVDSSDCAR